MAISRWRGIAAGEDFVLLGEDQRIVGDGFTWRLQHPGREVEMVRTFAAILAVAGIGGVGVLDPVAIEVRGADAACAASSARKLAATRT